MLLENKVAVITGSGRGIGRGIARRFAREGARVVVNDKDDDVIARTAKEIRDAGGTCLEVPADVSVETEVARLFDATLRAFGALDILVNNAQMFVDKGESGPFLRMTSA